MYKAFIAATGIVAATCLIAGCGGGGGETATASVTKAQFIKQADAVCKRYSKQREAKMEFKRHRPGGYAEAKSHIDDALKEVSAPSLKEQAEALKALTPPEKDVETVAQMFGNLSQAAEDIAAEGVKGIARPSHLADYEDEAERYGLKVCSNP